MTDSYIFTRFDHEEEDRIEYRFITTDGIEYYLYLVPANGYISYVENYEYLSTYGYNIGIFPIAEHEDLSKKKDPLVEKTVCAIIKHFVDNINGKFVILYHFDGGDSRQGYRSRLFNGWFLRNRDDYKLHKHELTVEIEYQEGHFVEEYLGYITGSPPEDILVIQEEFGSIAYALASGNK